MKCVKFDVYGFVHDVGYRYHTAQEAARLGVNGYVRNMSEGVVEVVACGDEDQINALVAFCRNNPGSSKVDRIDVDTFSSEETFSDFRVKY